MLLSVHLRQCSDGGGVNKGVHGRGAGEGDDGAAQGGELEGSSEGTVRYLECICSTASIEGKQCRGQLGQGQSDRGFEACGRREFEVVSRILVRCLVASLAPKRVAILPRGGGSCHTIVSIRCR